jgi:hypothetical protein
MGMMTFIEWADKHLFMIAIISVVSFITLLACIVQYNDAVYNPYCEEKFGRTGTFATHGGVKNTVVCNYLGSDGIIHTSIIEIQ